MPKLRLGVKLAKGGVSSTGPHSVKFVEEPIVILGKDHEGKQRKELKFIVEENGIRYRWNVPIMNKEGTQPNYLMERIMDISIGDERILEMMRQGARNYVDVRKPDEAPEPPDDEEDPEIEDIVPDKKDN